MLRKAVVILVLLALASVVVAWRTRAGSRQAAKLQTVQVARGDLAVTISATGTIEPEDAIDVGAQVGGKVLSFGKGTDDQPVDYGSSVEEGALLARIDEALHTAQVEQALARVQQAEGKVLQAAAEVQTAEAQVQVAEAEAQSAESQIQAADAKVNGADAGVQQAEGSVVKAEADLRQLQAKLDQARSDWDRAQKLGPSEALAQSSFDAYKAAYEGAVANVAVGEAAIRIAKATRVQAASTVAETKASATQARAAAAKAKAAVAQARGTLAQAKSTIPQAEGQLAEAKGTLAEARRNLSYCTITSPVKGVIIARRVNVGQTVVASMETPSLFLIAKDLRQMQIWVAVNEADIGRIKPGQPVTFTVDAFPGETFRGAVRKVRLNASMTQNVVTYTVEISTDNASGRLLPYLTANVKFEVARADNALLVPSAALRWTPSLEQVAPEYREGPPATPNGSKPASETAGGQPASPGSTGTTATPGILWVIHGQYVRPIPVTVGLSDGVQTEVRGEGVEEGMEVVAGVQAQGAAAPSGTANPFTPKMPKPPPKVGGGGPPV
jgi:HlyD family secretion protein